jgi:leucyl-tRNA synthetase
MILAEGGVKMSKSIGNTIDPKDIVNIYGADTLRIYEMFMGPFDQAVTWSTESIIGSRRFLDKVWRIGERIGSSSSCFRPARGKDSSRQSDSAPFQTLLHKTIKKIEEDIEGMSFNTAISSMMVLVNEMEKNEISISDFKKLLQILAPFAPHLTEELWQQLEKPKTKNQKLKSIHLSFWPKWDKNKILDEKIVVAVQVNGKVRAEISIDKDMEEEGVKKLALTNKGVLSWIENKEIKRFIYVKGRIINIVV